jgi:hypothetical protein
MEVTANPNALNFYAKVGFSGRATVATHAAGSPTFEDVLARLGG